MSAIRSPVRLLWLVALLGCVTHSLAQAPAEQIKFDILEFVVEGNSVLPAATIERAIYPFTGPSRSVSDAEAARKALEKAYQDAGFLSVIVELPPQQVRSAGGEVRLLVTEAPVTRVRVTGAEYSLPSEIRAQLPSLAPGTVPNFNDMQEELGALAQRSAEREITPLVVAGEQPGTLAVELKVQETLPLNAFVELNNKQAENTKRGRLEANVSYDNLFQRQHSLGVYWFVSPRDIDQSNIISTTYAAPLGGIGDRLFFVYTYSDSNTPTPVGGATVSAGDTFALLWRDELKSFGRYQHSLTYGVRYYDLQDNNRDVAGFDVESPPVRYPSLNLNYAINRPGEKQGRFSTVEAGLAVGIRGLTRREVDCFGRRVDQFECKRAGAEPDFQVLSLGASHREPLPGDWALSARLRTQFASGPLVPSEQITLGGFDSVRGYFDGQYAGDSGGFARLEVFSPRLFAFAGAGLSALAFVDRGLLVRSDPLPGEQHRIHIGSYGFGLRITSNIGLEARLDWADVIFEPVSLVTTPAVGVRSAGGPQRWAIGVRWTY